MKHTKTTTKINNEQSLQLISVAGLQDLSDDESQTIQGGNSSLGTLRGYAGRISTN